MLRYGMGREDYERLRVLPQGVVPGSPEAAEVLAAEYPRATGAAVAELRSRGYAATVPLVDYLVRKGTIPHPGGEGRNRLWSREAIDHAAEYFEAEQAYTPEATAWAVFNVNPAQGEEALAKCLAENPGLTEEELIIEIVPGRPGKGEYATVRYRPVPGGEK